MSSPTNELNVIIGTCDQCGRPMHTNQPRHLVNGLWEHQQCPLVSLIRDTPEPAA